MVEALSVDGLVFRNNIMTRSQTFEALNSEKKAFNFENCKNVLIEGNRLYGKSVMNSDIMKDSSCKEIIIK